MLNPWPPAVLVVLDSVVAASSEVPNLTNLNQLSLGRSLNWGGVGSCKIVMVLTCAWVNWCEYPLISEFRKKEHYGGLGSGLVSKDKKSTWSLRLDWFDWIKIWNHHDHHGIPWEFPSTLQQNTFVTFLDSPAVQLCPATAFSSKKGPWVSAQLTSSAIMVSHPTGCKVDAKSTPFKNMLVYLSHPSATIFIKFPPESSRIRCLNFVTNCSLETAPAKHWLDVLGGFCRHLQRPKGWTKWEIFEVTEMYDVWHYDWLWLMMYQSLIDDVWHCRTKLIMARLCSSPEIGLAFNVWEHSAWKVLVSACKMVHTLWSQRRLRFGNNPKLAKCDHNRILLEHLRFLSCFGASSGRSRPRR